MRLEQTCPCGSEIKVDFAPHAINTRETERQAERNEARKLIDQWRTAHRPCLKRLVTPAQNVVPVEGGAWSGPGAASSPSSEVTKET